MVVLALNQAKQDTEFLSLLNTISSKYEYPVISQRIRY